MAHKIAIVIYSSLKGDGVSANFRAYNFAEELLDAGDDVVMVFDGAGSKALAEVLDSDQLVAKAFAKARPALGGVCEYCSKAYKVHDDLDDHDIPMLGGFKGHISMRRFLEEGRQIVTF